MFKVIVILLVGFFNFGEITPCVPMYGQCDGTQWTGSKTCCDDSVCTFGNDYYSQCLPKSDSSTTPGTTSKTTSSSGGGGTQDGVTTRYWDCCKASCGWTGKASVSNPVQTCAADGVTPVGVDTQSGCNGGSAYMCLNQQPWNVSATLSYGFAAAHISGQQESDWCCACYSMMFTSGPVAGKQLIVQVTNTGGDLGNNHFDLEIPGGGVGIFDGCSTQFPGPYSWGDRYGGVKAREDCFKIPAELQPGCLWRFDWFQGADNPTMRFEQVACPSVLTDKSQCVRK